MAFEVRAACVTHTFDSFEYAIHTMAPCCERCGVMILGHGHQVDGAFYCCAHCAGATKDHV